MNDDRRKKLTEFLGHKDITNYDNDNYHKCLCGKEYHMTSAGSIAFTEHIGDNRTFATEKDMVDLAKGLVIKNLAYDFQKSPVYLKEITGVEPWEIMFWFITGPARFCELVGEFLESGRTE